MNPPARITDGAANGLGARLVRSARADAPPAASRQRALAAVALASAATATSASAAAAGGALARAALVKWLAWGGGGLVLAVALGAAVVAGNGQNATPVSSASTALAPASLSTGSVAPSAAPSPASSAAGMPRGPIAIPVEALPSVIVPPSSVRAGGALITTPPKAAASAEGTEGPVPAASAGRSALTREIALLDEAKVALDASRPDAALAVLDRHAREFPRAALAPEATALRIEALARRGDRAAASALFRRFEEKNPKSPLLDHVRPFAGAAPSDD